MRWYELIIGGGPTWNSRLINGENDPNALRVTFTIEIDKFTLSKNSSYISIYGVNLATLAAASSYFMQRVQLYGGFMPGLPLATIQSHYSGLLIDAMIYAAAGNWRGNDVTLDLLLLPSQQASGNGGTSGGTSGGATGGGGGLGLGGYSPSFNLMKRRLPTSFAPKKSGKINVSPRDGDGSGGGDGGGLDLSSLAGDIAGGLETLAQSAFGGGGFLQTPANLIHNMMPGTPLASAIQQTLSTAYPNSSIDTSMVSSMSTSYQDASFHQNLSQYIGYLKQLAVSLTKGKSTGIDLYSFSNKLTAIDGTIPPGYTVALQYQDIIGQPVWVGPFEIKFSTILRADIIPPTTMVTFPSNIIFGSSPSYSDTSFGINVYTQSLATFNGTAWVHKARHVGDSRSPDGNMWRSDFWAWTWSGSGTTAQQQALAVANQGLKQLGLQQQILPPDTSTQQLRRFTSRARRRW